MWMVMAPIEVESRVGSRVGRVENFGELFLFVYVSTNVTFLLLVNLVIKFAVFLRRKSERLVIDSDYIDDGGPVYELQVYFGSLAKELRKR